MIDAARALGSDSFDDTERALRRHDPRQLQPGLFEERGKLRFGPLASTPVYVSIATSRSLPQAERDREPDYS